MLYMFLIAGLSVVGTLVFVHAFKRFDRFPLYFLWMPVAISTIIVLELVRFFNF